ncbi:unnamed protein product [Didymodactylos carnosus]|uniref:Uncharacterized protein n=1 Tax=Didymodactylos carnosus TaxID=1234261 RepID=A0A814Y3R7_9BILA|nr:unnamed protein product [Didymodactylos carnosus]CAF3987317.1 unnamed protein product [Didymodactylos carnosus]
MLLSLHHQTSTTTTNCRLTKKTPKTCNNSNDDEFYAKLQKIRLSTSAKKPTRGRTAAELLEESKAYFVKSKEVLKKRQCFNEQSLTIPKTTDEYQFVIPQTVGKRRGKDRPKKVRHALSKD